MNIMERSTHTISFVLKVAILISISILLFLYFSNLQPSLDQSSNAVDIQNITVETVNYLWNMQYPQNAVFLLFLTFVILLLITHAIIIYQEGVDNYHG